jgi:hypothetical protein
MSVTTNSDSWLSSGMREVMASAQVSAPSSGDSSNTEEDLNAVYAIWNAFRLSQQSPPDYSALATALGAVDYYNNISGLDPSVQAMVGGAVTALEAAINSKTPASFDSYIEDKVAAQTVQWMNSDKEGLQALMASGASNADIFDFTNIIMGLSVTKNGQGAADIDSFFSELSNPPTPIMLLAYFYTQDGDNMTQALADLKAYASTLPQPPAGVSAPNYQAFLQELQATINNPPSAAYFSYYMQQEDIAIQQWLNS